MAMSWTRLENLHGANLHKLARLPHVGRDPGKQEAIKLKLLTSLVPLSEFWYNLRSVTTLHCLSRLWVLLVAFIPPSKLLPPLAN